MNMNMNEINYNKIFKPKNVMNSFKNLIFQRISVKLKYIGRQKCEKTIV